MQKKKDLKGVETRRLFDLGFLWSLLSSGIAGFFLAIRQAQRDCTADWDKRPDPKEEQTLMCPFSAPPTPAVLNFSLSWLITALDIKVPFFILFTSHYCPNQQMSMASFLMTVCTILS